jgi:O-antigen/teichoic acid export membrane protein
VLKRFVTYSASLYAAAIFAAGIGVVIKSLIAKTVGKEALGIYSYLITLATLGGSILAFGLGRTLAKYVAEKRDDQGGEVVGGILSLLVLISLILAAAGLLTWGHIEQVYSLALIAVGPYTFFELTRAILRGQLERNREAPAAFLAALLRLAMVVLCAILIGGIWSPTVGLVLAYIGTALAALAYFFWRHPAWWGLRRLGRVYSEPGFWSVLGLTAPLWVADVVAVISDQADRLLVQGQLGYSVLAEYSAAFTIVFLVAQPVTVMSRMYLVTFARGYYTTPSKYGRIIAINLAFIPTTALVVVALTEPLTRILFTAEYGLVPMLVAILSIAFVPKSAEVINTAMTIARDYPQANRNGKILITIVYLPVAFLLVRTYGAMGAAWSYVLSWSGYAFIHMAFMYRRLPQQAVSSFRLTIASLILYGVIFTITQLAPLGMLSILFAPLYLVAGHLLRIWDLGDVFRLTRKFVRSYLPTTEATESRP